MKKAALAARGMLPQVVPVESDVIESGLNLLAVTDVDSKIEELAEETALAIELSEFCTQLEGLDVQDDADDDAIDILQILGLNIV
ncbi:hypothetical protein AaE_002986 [Aphanomyces astaci]|nr:hypothetical protein AaE_002986 [Aphanomyces astaci]